jgi:hypothetical protein
MAKYMMMTEPPKMMKMRGDHEVLRTIAFMP